MSSSSLATLRRLLPLAGLTLFAVILARMDTSAILRALAGVDPALFACGMLIVVAFQLCKAARHALILRCQGIDLPFWPAFLIYMKSTFWGLVSPGRLGEFSKVGYLKSHAATTSASAASVVVDRLFDVLAALTFLTASGMALGQPEGLTLALASLAFGAALVGGVGLLGVLAARRASPSPVAAFLGHIAQIRRKLPLMGLSLAIWSLYYFGMYVLARSLGLAADPVFMTLCVSASNLVSIIPVSVAGIGTRDALLLALFARQGLPAEAAIAYSSFFLAAFVVLAVATAPFLLCDTSAKNDQGTP